MGSGRAAVTPPAQVAVPAPIFVISKWRFWAVFGRVIRIRVRVRVRVEVRPRACLVSTNIQTDTKRPAVTICHIIWFRKCV